MFHVYFNETDKSNNNQKEKQIFEKKTTKTKQK